MANTLKKRRSAILLFLAAAAMFAAAIITYASSGELQWLQVVAGVLMAAVGLRSLLGSARGDA